MLSMMRMTAFRRVNLIVLLIACIHVYSCGALYGSDCKVKELTSHNYMEILDDITVPVMLVEFYAPWCGHCKTIAPVIKKLAEKVSSYMPICSVDCDAQRDICERFGIQGFPTLKIVQLAQIGSTSKKKWLEYKHARDVDSLQHSLHHYCPSLIQPLSESDAPSVLTNTSHIKAYIFPGFDQDIVPVKFISWQFQNKILFYNGTRARQAIRKYFNLSTFPFLLLQITNTNAFEVFSFPANTESSTSKQIMALSSYLSKYVISLPELNSSDDFSKYCLNSEAPICLIALIRDPFSDQSINRLRTLEEISAQRTSTSTPFSFMWINRDIHADLMINYNPETYEEKTDPDVLIFNSKREKFGAWFNGHSWDKQTLLSMLDEIKIGNTKLSGNSPQFHPFYEWISAERDNEKQEL